MPPPLEGIFLSLSEGEAAEIWTAVKAAGLPENSEGARELFLGLIEGDGEMEDSWSQKAANYIQDNPELVSAAIDKGKTLFAIIRMGLKLRK